MKPAIIIMEEDGATTRLIAEELGESYHLVVEQDPATAFSQAMALKPVLIMAEIRLVPLLSEWRTFPRLTNVPVLFLAWLDDEPFTGALPADGAQDILVKPFSPVELRLRVHNLVTLKKYKDRDHDLFESMQDGFCIVELIFDEHDQALDYRFLETNGTFEKQTGLIDAKGKRMRELAPHHEQHWFDIYGKVALTGESVRFENRADALHRWFEVYAFRVGAPENRQVAIFFNDILERKRAEEKLKQEHDELITAARTKDDFLAILSHELRTPLNPVLMIASSAADDHHLPPSVRTDFNTIRKNIEIEARLIDDLLDLTPVTRAKIILDKQYLDLHEALKDAVTRLREEITQKQIVFTLNLGASQAMVFADAVRLRQVFWNVLRNAVKFTPAGGSVTVATESGTHNQIIIRVTDTGIGLTAEELGRIFKPFSQGDHAVSLGNHSFGGLGLGLTITQKLLELHSGRIQVQSAGRDQGAIFAIELPAAQRPGLPERSPGQPPPSSIITLAAKAQLNGFRILLVEDHEPTRQILTKLLVRRHHRVVAADCLAVARDLIEAHVFDILISDIGLPDGTGNQLMEEVRARGGIKGVAISGYGTEEDVARSRAAGFVAHLTKPVTIQSLETALAALS